MLLPFFIGPPAGIRTNFWHLLPPMFALFISCFELLLLVPPQSVLAPPFLCGAPKDHDNTSVDLLQYGLNAQEPDVSARLLPERRAPR